MQKKKKKNVLENFEDIEKDNALEEETNNVNDMDMIVVKQEGCSSSTPHNPNHPDFRNFTRQQPENDTRNYEYRRRTGHCSYLNRGSFARGTSNYAGFTPRKEVYLWGGTIKANN